MSNNATCANCHKVIRRDHYGRWWYHNGGFTSCWPGLGTVAVPIPKRKIPVSAPPPPSSRISGTNAPNSERVTHLVPELDGGYMTACGKRTRDSVEGINQTTLTCDVTCSRCQQTIKYRQTQEQEQEPVAYQTSTCINCGEDIRLTENTNRWVHFKGPVTFAYCEKQAMGSGLIAKPVPLESPRISATNTAPNADNIAVTTLLQRREQVVENLNNAKRELGHYQGVVRQMQDIADNYGDEVRAETANLADLDAALTKLGHERG